MNRIQLWSGIVKEVLFVFFMRVYYVMSTIETSVVRQNQHQASSSFTLQCHICLDNKPCGIAFRSRLRRSRVLQGYSSHCSFLYSHAARSTSIAELENFVCATCKVSSGPLECYCWTCVRLEYLVQYYHSYVLPSILEWWRILYNVRVANFRNDQVLVEVSA